MFSLRFSLKNKKIKYLFNIYLIYFRFVKYLNNFTIILNLITLVSFYVINNICCFLYKIKIYLKKKY